jgi:glycosyltransferase involved in cell wall biosynthesis
MRVGLNLLYLIPSQVGGVERYAAGLLEALANLEEQHEYIVFVNQEAADWHLPDDSRFRRVVCSVQATSRWRRYLFEQIRLPWLLTQYRADIVHSLSYVTPLRTKIPSIVTIHDLNYKAFGDLMPLSKRLALTFFVRQSAIHANQIITDSHFSRQEILAAYKISPQKVHVLYPGAPTEKSTNNQFAAIRQQLKIDPPYIIAFSSRTPNKNIERLLQSFRLAQQKHHLSHQLVLVGHLPPHLLPIIEEDNSRIKITGYIDDQTLDQVLANAQLLVFPSIYEGFGLPILEAMVANIPVVSSTAGSLPEVGGEAARYFDPYDIESMAQAIAEVALKKELRHDLRTKAKANISRFSWPDTAAQTIELYKQALDTPGTSPLIG